MQKAYLLTLFEIAEKDPDVVLLLADSGTAYDELFQKQLPHQVYDFGIAEENMVAAAAGLASCDIIPFVFTAGAFLAYRSLEFIRNDICLQAQNVKLIGAGAGLGWSTLGPTHHTTEDLAILCAMPGLTVLTPSTPVIAAKCVRAAYQTRGPFYIRLGMGGEAEFYSDNIDFSLGKNLCLRDGKDIAVFSSGAIIEEVVAASELLAEDGISAKIIDVISNAPFDMESVVTEAASKKALITIDEHSLTGGIGSAVSDTLTERNISCRLLKLGLCGTFAKGYGTYAQVRAQNALDAASIAARIKKWLKENGI